MIALLFFVICILVMLGVKNIFIYGNLFTTDIVCHGDCFYTNINTYIETDRYGEENVQCRCLIFYCFSHSHTLLHSICHLI